MTSNTFLSIACGALVWLLGVSFYLTSFYAPILQDPAKQANIVLILAIVPSSFLGAYLFYKKGLMKPALLALTFVIVAALLDAFITVPVFIIPAGGNHTEFFSDPMFYVIAAELYLVTCYFGKHQYQHQNIKK
ncbi:hypothetical protein [Flagellimonas zhangzhouensis]|uniref:Uncharacterized protein n=1 Tax=Flagellimonas zhangzhouensis TaxID=1073328 RepID=A0A1H2VYK2_9FLAO|nr:hypothetical protein [Allomuricauda zhangzhouensis]SDQ04881.1 hypothetical protein SAMN05216294_0014 [Allomuricauda zhangzhouensis]SDW73297.1 hypothetical protein SAMN04487892_2278 [Allomuricauda zhangzhouensis]